MPGSSFTTMGPDAYCETCPDACYVDFNDDGIPDAEQNGTFSTNGTFRNNSTNSAPVPAPVVIADTNFENGTGDPLTSSASSPNVTAVIAQSNDSTPLMAQSGQSYLFLTFNSGSGSQQQQLLRRQSSDQPLVYNASQNFPTVAGDTYNVTAYAQQAQDGPNPPDCSISLCVYDSCSTSASLSTGVWQQYYYLYLATYDDDSATATFSITCGGNAYVGLDNIAIVDIPPPDNSASTSSTGGSGSGSSAPSGSSVSLTTLSGGSVITVTRTIVRTRTTSAIVSTAVYYTTTQVSYVVSTYESDNTYTTYQPTTLVSTAYATATSLQNITVSAIVTSTTTITQNQTFTQLSTAFVTATATSLQVQTTSIQPYTIYSNNHDALFDSSPDFAESATDYDHIDGFFYASAAEHHSRRNDQSGSIHHDVRFKLFDNVLPNSNWPNPDHDPTSLNILYDHHKQPRSYHSDALFDFASRDLHILSYKHASSNHSNDISSIHRTSKSHSPASNPIRNDTHHIHPSGLQLYDSPDDFRNTSLDIRNYLASLDSSFDGRPDHLPSRKHDDGSRANDNSSWAYRDLASSITYTSYSTSIQPASTITEVTTVVSSAPGTTSTIISTYLTTAPPQTITATSLSISVQPASTIITTQLVTQPASTVTTLSIQPASTITTLSIQPASTVTTLSVQPANTVTTLSIQPASTITTLSLSIQPASTITHLFDYSASQYCGQHESNPHHHSGLFIHASLDLDLDGYSYSYCHINRYAEPNNNTNSDADADTNKHNNSLCHYHGSSPASKHSDNHLYLVPRDATTGHIHPIPNHNSNVDSHNNCYDNTAQHCLRSYASASNLYGVPSYSSACNKYTDTDCNNDIYASVYHDADSYEYCSSKYCDNHIHVVSSDTSASHVYSIHNYDSDIDRYYYSLRSYSSTSNLHGVSRYSSACDKHTDADSDRHANSNCYDNSTGQYGYFSATSCHHYPNTDIDLHTARTNDHSDVDCDRYASPAAQLATAGSRTTTASSTVAAPTVALASPTAIFNSSQAHDDDLAWRVMPFAINLCGYNFTNVTVSVNGVLGFGITNSYSPSSLPQYSALSPSGYALMPFWADLYIYQGTAQGIYYEVDGTSPSRILTFEYYASYYQQSNNYYHFQVLFYENNTGSFTFKYLNITDSGANAVVGYQCQPKSKYKQYSSKQAIITNGLRVDYTYSNDTFTSSQVVAASRATVLSPVIDFMSRIAGKVSDTWRSATGWLRDTTLAAIRKMSSPEQSSTEKKNNKTRETCRHGPEDGYPFIVDEVFKQRGPEPIPEPVAVRRVSRPAGPHRASKKAAVVESESSAVRVGEVAPGSTSIQVSSMQTPTNNPFAVSNAGLQPSSRISEITRGQHQIKDTSRPIESAARPASLHTNMPGVYAESDDGGVELPEHIDSEINHDAARRVEAGSGPDSSGAGTPEHVSKHDGGGEGKLGVQPSTGAGKTGAKDVAHEGDKLERIFARLDALKRPGRGN
ncbi:hypothetical protein KCV03_g7906, partial [Aureobasidium melanogenum]